MHARARPGADFSRRFLSALGDFYVRTFLKSACEGSVRKKDPSNSLVCSGAYLRDTPEIQPRDTASVLLRAARRACSRQGRTCACARAS